MLGMRVKITQIEIDTISSIIEMIWKKKFAWARIHGSRFSVKKQ